MVFLAFYGNDRHWLEAMCVPLLPVIPATCIVVVQASDPCSDPGSGQSHPFATLFCLLDLCSLSFVFLAYLSPLYDALTLINRFNKVC